MQPEARLMQLASRQASVFSRSQALACGLSSKQVRARVETGLWRLIHRGVYVQSSVRVTWRQLIWAALLACGPTAVAAYRSAGMVWSLVESFVTPEVSVGDLVVRVRPGITVHRTERLDRVVHQGFRVTNPMRTVLDLADSSSEHDIARFVDDAHRRGIIDIRRMRAFVADDLALRRPGSGLLREILDDRDPDRPINSHLESDLFELLRKAGLPLPEPAFKAETRYGLRYMDFAYPEQRVAIEVDSWKHHGSREAFEEDRLRGNELEAMGWRFQHVTDRQIKRNPVDVALLIATAIGYEPTRWTMRRRVAALPGPEPFDVRDNTSGRR